MGSTSPTRSGRTTGSASRKNGSYRASLRDSVDLLARIDGAVGGSAIGAIRPEWPELVLALVTVLPERRRLGAGTALDTAISAWAGSVGSTR